MTLLGLEGGGSLGLEGGGSIALEGGGVPQVSARSTGVSVVDVLTMVLPSRTEGFRWDLLDSGGGVIGTLHPEKVVSMTNSSSGQIKRKVTGFTLPPDEAADVNTVSDRVQPWFLLDVGGTINEWPLGVFLFGDASSRINTFGDPLDAPLQDQGQILSYPITRTISYNAGVSIGTAMLEVCELAGFPDATIDSTSAVFSSPVAWVGSNQQTWAKVLTELCKMAGFYDWYFLNAGGLVLRGPDDLSALIPDLRYLAGRNIARGSLVVSNDQLNAPNLWKVIDTSASASEIVGTYELPSSSPISFVNRGYYVTEWIPSPGIGSVTQAEVAAQTAAQTAKSYETISWASPIDPRHETFDPVDVLEQTYVESNWSIRCEPGGASMRHEAQRIYA